MEISFINPHAFVLFNSLPKYCKNLNSNKIILISLKGKTAAPKKLTQWEKNVLNNLKIKQEQNFKKFEEKEIELQQIDRDEE